MTPNGQTETRRGSKTSLSSTDGDDEGAWLPPTARELLDFLQTCEDDVQFLSDLRIEHYALLCRLPTDLRRVDSVVDSAHRTLAHVREVVFESGLDKIRRSKSPWHFRKWNMRKFVDADTFRHQERAMDRQNAAVLGELLHVRQLALTPSSVPPSPTYSNEIYRRSGEDGHSMMKGSASRFSNIGLLAGMMGDVTIEDSQRGYPPFRARKSATFPLAELADTAVRPRNSGTRASCPDIGQHTAGGRPEQEPAEIRRSSYFSNTDSELVVGNGIVFATPVYGAQDGKVSSCSSFGQPDLATSPESISTCFASPSSPPPPPPSRRSAGDDTRRGENGAFLRSPSFQDIQNDPNTPHALQPFSQIRDLTPFIRPLPPLPTDEAPYEKHTSDPWNDVAWGRPPPPTTLIYEEKEVVVRNSMKKKSAKRIVLNPDDKSGLALLIGQNNTDKNSRPVSPLTASQGQMPNNASETTHPTTGTLLSSHSVTANPPHEEPSDLGFDSTDWSRCSDTTLTPRQSFTLPCQEEGKSLLSTIPSELLYCAGGDYHPNSVVVTPKSKIGPQLAVVVAQDERPLDTMEISFLNLDFECE